jgi:LEA14-like dessication related protein
VVGSLVAKRIVAAVIIIVVVVVIAGFAIYYYDAYHKLTFQLKSVSLSSASLTSVKTNFGLAIGNPGPLPIYVPSGSFNVYINEVSVGTGSFSSLTVGGNSQSLITVPVDFNPTTLPSTVYNFITGGGSVTVTIVGSANLALFSVPFNATLYNASFK